MATINIIIKVIAMSYHKEDGLWKILFPFGECHEVKFKENPEDAGIALAHQDRQITITTETADSNFEIADNYYDFLDLTADYSHANGIKTKDEWEENAVLMTIENAKLSVDEFTKTEHMMIRKDIVTFAPNQIGYSARAVINAKRVTINIDDHPDFPKVFDRDCTLVFDNDCEQGDSREISDFELVYKIIEDADVEQERFVVTKAPNNIDFPIFVGTTFNPIRDKDIKDPFKLGLPCHLVRVSKAENLP